MTRNFDVFFDLSLNKQLSKPLRRRWFETQSNPLWRQCNVEVLYKMPVHGYISSKQFNTKEVHRLGSITPSSPAVMRCILASVNYGADVFISSRRYSIIAGSDQWVRRSVTQTVYKFIIQSFWLIYAARTCVILMQSRHNFAHVTTAELSWHAQNCDLIDFLNSELGRNEHVQDFSYRPLNILWNGSQPDMLLSPCRRQVSLETSR